MLGLILALLFTIQDPAMDAKAQAHAEVMADAGKIFHSSLGYAENVGRGASVESVMDAFWNSPAHRANMEGDWTHQGTGVAWRDGVVYVVLIFDKRDPAPNPVTKPPAPRPRAVPPKLVPVAYDIPVVYWTAIAGMR